MFLSQKIAKDPKFLKHATKEETRSLVDVRVKIMNAAKFIIGSEQFDLGIASGNLNNHCLELALNEKGLIERISIYTQFAKLPFRSIFLENSRYGVLVEATNHDTALVTVITTNATYCPNNGFLSSASVEIRLTEGSFVPVATNGAVHIHFYSDKGYSEYENSKNKERAQGTFLFIAMQVAEILLFLNMRNVKTRKYTLNKTESVKIPKQVLPKYEYHVLDIYRDRPVYESVQDIENELFSNAEETLRRRMHFVRGHFKQKKNGLFWWNSFVRNARNIDIGVVDKSYRLNR